MKIQNFCRLAGWALSILGIWGAVFAQPVLGNDQDAGIAYIRGKELVLKGDYEKAIPFLEKALQSDPKSAIVNAQLAEVHLRLRNVEKAEEFGKRAVDADPENHFRARRL